MVYDNPPHLYRIWTSPCWQQPNTLEGVVALEVGDIEEEGEHDFERKHFGTKIFELAYDSRYRPSWIWMRGRSKKDWVERVWKTYQYRPSPGSQSDMVADDDMERLKEATALSIMNWTTIMGLTILLMGIPFVLAFLTGFYTPQVGLSCRSLTFSVYAICQVSQLALWLWAYAGVPQEEGSFSFIRKGGWLDRHGFYTPTAVRTLWSRKTFFLPGIPVGHHLLQSRNRIRLRRYHHCSRRNYHAAYGRLSER